MFLKILQNSHESTCTSLFFIKVAVLRPATLLKTRLWRRCFLWILRNFKNTFFTEHLRTSASRKYLYVNSFSIVKLLLVEALKFYVGENFKHKTSVAQLPGEGGEVPLTLFWKLKKNALTLEKMPWFCSYMGIIFHLKFCFKTILEKKFQNFSRRCRSFMCCTSKCPYSNKPLLPWKISACPPGRNGD